MVVHRYCNSGLCLHDLVGDDDNDSEYVEVDPTGRYGRYKEVLGRGAFKTVYKAFDQEDGIEVAWNQVQVHDDLQDLDRLYSEVNLLKTLKHKNIIKFYHSWMDRKTNAINFITERFTSGTLRQYRKKHRHVDIKAVKSWSRQILRGLLYLHSHDPPIIHRDLKCDNILINGNQGEVKIGDLGLATILQHAHPARSVIGTPEFMAPELYEEEYTELVDIYSFGMCLLEMVTAEYPYSECSNAAQIYKKVTSGKMPEALNKVKDPELCQFIKKCLATASKRLPARELLMDPFLQCEGSCKSVESLPETGWRIGKTNEKDDLSIFMDECNGKSAIVQISYKLKETIPNVSDDNCDSCVSSLGLLKSDLKAEHLGNENPSKYMPSSQSKEERARNVDFRVNGNRREDDTVFLRLRIAGPEGQVRNIHFPFDVESDTALCVASEMVAELDLTDQDVTKIAEMIDAAMLALVPEWKPGVAIDETYCDVETLVSSVVEDGLLSMVSVFDPSTTILSEGLLEEESSSLIRVLTPEVVSNSRVESTLYERIEEVTYQCHRSDFSAGVEQEECTVSSDLSANSKEVDWGSKDASSSGAPQLSNASLPKCEAVTSMFEEDSSRTQVRGINNTERAVAFNKLVESKRKARCINFSHKTWEGKVQDYPCLDYDAASVLALLPQKSEADICVHDVRVENLQQFIFAPPSLNVTFDWENECDDESAAQELSELACRHEQELRNLQHKHEAALSELRDRWHRNNLQSSSASNVYRQCGLPKLSHESDDTMQGTAHEGTYCLETNFGVDETSLRMSSGLKNVGSATSIVTDGSISEDVRVFLPYDIRSLNDSMTSYDDYSSLGQATPRSTLKAVQWQDPSSAIDAVVNVPSTDNILYSQVAYSRDCKSSTLQTPNRLKIERGPFSIPINAQAVEQVV